VWRSTPVAVPQPATTPGVRPSPRLRVSVYIVSGPGARTTRAAAETKAARVAAVGIRVEMPAAGM